VKPWPWARYAGGVLDAPASGRWRFAEAITNILGADVGPLSRSACGKLDGRCGEPGEDAALYATVRRWAASCAAVRYCDPGRQGLAVDEDRLVEGGQDFSVVAPVSLIVSAFAPVADVRNTLTPALQLDERPTSLWLIDLANGSSAWAARHSAGCTGSW